MASLTVYRNSGVGNKPAKHPKAKLRTSSGWELVLPFAPTTVEHGGLSPVFAVLDRPGRKPLLREAGQPMRTLTFTGLLARPDHQDDVEWYIARLRKLASTGHQVTFTYGPLESGTWRITDLAIEVNARQHGTNKATRATYTMTLAEAVDDVASLGPTTGGAKTTTTKTTTSTKKKATPKRHTVKSGDTLSRIASRYYGNANLWRRIATANKIRDPRKLKVGQRLTIPPK